jgi:hypothetical protein
MNLKLKSWLKTALMAAGGGGIAGAVAAAFDPKKYDIRHDIGSGKLWIFFFQGFGLTFLALLVKSPFGQQMIGAYKDSQSQLEQSRKEIERLKAQADKTEGTDG